MDIESFRTFCLSLPGATEGMKWDHLCFMIEEKIFVIVSLEGENRFSIKCDPENFDDLVAHQGINQAYHLAKRQWIQLENFSVLPEADIKQLVVDSRALVLAKLPKKIQAKYA